jgi:tight adherence protein C
MMNSTWKLRFAVLPVAVLCLTSTMPALAADSGLDVKEIRSEGFPRVAVRLNLTDERATAPAVVSPGQLHVVEDGQPQSSAELVPIRNPLMPTSVALAIDISSSMVDNGGLVAAKSAAKDFVSQLRPRDQAVVVVFNDDIGLAEPLTSDRPQLGQAIDSLGAHGSTRIYDALAQSASQLHLAPPSNRAVVLLTDGSDNASNWTMDDSVGQAVRDGIPVYAIGLGPGADSAALQSLADRTGGRYYQAPQATDLAQIFRLISRQLTAQYEVSWVSSLQDAGGRDVPVTISIDRPDGTQAVGSLTYQPPVFGRRPSSEPVNPVHDLIAVAGVAAPGQQQITMAGLLAGLAAFLMLVGFDGRRVNRRLHARMATYISDRSQAVRQAKPGAARHAPLSPFTSAAARLATRLLPSRQVERLRRKLVQAGHKSERHIGVFLATEVALGLLLAAGAYEFLHVRGFDQRNPLMGLMIAAMLGVLGLYIPYMWLRRRVEDRQRRLRRSLPDALDLMAIAVSAGLSLDSAMLEVVERWESELSQELQQVLTEMQLGASRRQALLNLVERTRLDELRLLVAALLQAEELGANVSQTLSVQAEQLRISRRQLAEEKARKAPIKMIVPLVGFIFPAMFVVLLAPAVLQFMATMHGFAHHG